ncbi:unnamed protein product [Gongylonema pulchrum]|uniref:Secreted protein n=1 Tax=Gongylonema pulchrum TaxID=637853 RepID=A0A183CX41_9BILA|nr:unnamed protein product [Gongylonema pulchrum]
MVDIIALLAYIYLVLTAVMVCFGAVRRCCASGPTERIQVSEIVADDGNTDGDSAISNPEIVACKARCDAQWKSDFYVSS